jgi:hypothetical protein
MSPGPKVYQKVLTWPSRKWQVGIENTKKKESIKHIEKHLNETPKKDPKCYLNIP